MRELNSARRGDSEQEQLSLGQRTIRDLATRSPTKRRDGVFISYRQADSADATARIWSGLIKRFGKTNVFRDEVSIEPGENFPKAIEEFLARTAVMVVVIGPKWIDIKDTAGERRLDDNEDYVRAEIEVALQRGAMIIPVLLDEASMPQTSALPLSLQALANKQSLGVRRGLGHDADMKTLIRRIERGLPGHVISRRRLIWLGSASVITLSAVGAGTVLYDSLRTTGPRWSFTIPFYGTPGGDKDTGVINRPAVAHGTVFVVATNGNMYALDAIEGTMQWQTEADSQLKAHADPKLKTAPSVSRGVVSVGADDGTICAFDAGTGQLLWQTPRHLGIYASSVTAVEDLVYAGSDDGNLYALEVSSGQQQWAHSMPGKAPLSSPTVADGLLCVASDDGSVYTFGAIHGDLKWQCQADAWTFSAPALADGAVYVGSAYGRVSALDMDTGNSIWNPPVSTSGHAAVASPVVVDGIVYLASEDRNVYALDVTDGKQRWSFSADVGMFTVPAVARGAVYIGLNNGALCVIDGSTGRRRIMINVGQGGVSTPTLANGIVYVGSAQGVVVAYDI